MYTDLLNSIRSLLQNVSLYSSIDMGALPPNNGISMYLGPGSNNQTFFDKGTTYSTSIVVNAKHKDQLTCLQALSDIHSYITRLKDYPNNENWQILNIKTSTAPNYIGQEQSNQYLYGSILEVLFYIKGVEN